MNSEWVFSVSYFLPSLGKSIIDEGADKQTDNV